MYLLIKINVDVKLHTSNNIFDYMLKIPIKNYCLFNFYIIKNATNSL